ncbi:hypothetical protein F1880_003999 [Penicillium rolfsii]|nr:hypothetical protein F1880_003999 [Penicillium rolfsii]
MSLNGVRWMDRVRGEPEKSLHIDTLCGIGTIPTATEEVQAYAHTGEVETEAKDKEEKEKAKKKQETQKRDSREPSHHRGFCSQKRAPTTTTACTE